MTCTEAVLLSVVGASSVSDDESLPSQSSSTTLVEQFEEETGIVWSQIDDNTIEVSLPD